jgi:hypothetical protein
VKYKLGYISTKESYENLQDLIDESSFENIGYINPIDFKLTGTLNLEMAANFANQVDAIVIVEGVEIDADLVAFLVKRSLHLLFLNRVKSVIDLTAELEHLLHESGTVLQIENLERNKPVYTSLRQYLRKPKYCRLERWTTNHLNITEQLVDDIDMAVNCFQSGVANVDCHTGNIFNNNVDLINLKLSFQNGAIADIQLHAAGSEMKSEGLFVAENGYYQVDFSNHEIVEIVHANNDQLSLMDNAALQPRLAKFSKKILVFNPVKKAFHNFYENISHGFTPLVNIDDAKNIAHVLQKAQYIMQRNCVNWA